MPAITVEIDTTKAYEVIREHIRKQSAAEMQQLAKKIYTGVIQRSPVDSGKFRANWNVSANAPNTSTDESAKVPKPFPFLAGAREIFVGNYLRYAGIIEHGLYPTRDSAKVTGGFSRQAPHGVMRPTLQSLVGSMR